MCLVASVTNIKDLVEVVCQDIFCSEGCVLEKKDLTRDQAYQWGALLGKMHKCLSSMKCPSVLERRFLWSWEGLEEVREYVDVSCLKWGKVFNKVCECPHEADRRTALLDILIMAELPLSPLFQFYDKSKFLRD